MLYLAIQRLSRKWIMSIRDCKGASLNQMAIKYEGRIEV